MIVVKHNNKNPYINHAIEEYLMDKLNEKCFILWQNEKSILIGKNQNTLSEIDLEYVNEKNIKIVRRMSGGGSVFCDLGNLNFTFISPVNEGEFCDFKSFTEPIINALKSLNIDDVEFSGRNDITIKGKKISGNAQYRKKGRVLHHGTLLYSADLSELIGALKVRPIKFKDKAVKSVESRVCNIIEHMDKKMNVEDFKEYIEDYVLNNTDNAKVYTLTNDDIKEIEKISNEKYSTWNWNFGESPKYDFHSEDKFKCGVVEIYLSVNKGLIENIKIYGDFFSPDNIEILENLLNGKKHEKNEIENIIENINISNYINGIEKREFINLLFN